MTIMPPIDHTLLDLDMVMEAEVKNEKPRPYLGMSAIGHDCWRKLWMDLRLVSKNNFKAETLRNFADGHYSEDLSAARLQKIPGIDLHTHNEQGKQFGFSDLGGHFRGHMDGAILGISQAPKSWHVWEHKCTNETKYRKMDRLKIKEGDKNALALWDFVYYCQAILYMHYSLMPRHYLTVATSGSRKYTTCRTKENPQEVKNLIDKAEMIITSTQPLDKISNKPDYYQCGWCPHNGVCHGTETAIPSCRSCIHAAPVMEGTEGEWTCAKHETTLTFEQQQAGCCDHLFIPQFLENFATQVDATETAVSYKHNETGVVFWNGLYHEGNYTSWEIHECKNKELLGDKNIETMRKEFDGEIVG